MECQCKIEWNCLYFAESTNPGYEFLVFFLFVFCSVLFLLVAAVCLPLCDTQVSSAL